MRKVSQEIDYTSRDYQAYKDLLIQKLQEKMPEYTDTSETDAGIVILEALANGLDICSYYADAIANDVILATTQDRRLAVLLAQDLGYTPYNQTASKIPMVFTLEIEQDEDVVIGRGTEVTTVETDDVEAIVFETIEDLTIPAGCLGNEKDAYGNYLYTVLAVQGETIEDDYIGSSNGAPNQTFVLSYSQVLVDSINLYVDEGNGESLWTRVNNFQDCKPTSKVYSVTIDEDDNCTIVFGNGAKGKIPSPFDNGIRADYRVGGGVIGNVKEGTVTVMETDIAYVESCTNLEPEVLGHEKESIDEIRYNAPAHNRTRDRAVTLMDYEDLLCINVGNFDELYAILNTKAIRNSANNLKVDLYYQMRDGYEMTEKLSELIDEFFSTRTMIGTTFTLIPYVPNVINIGANLVVSKDYIRQEVKEEVIEYIKSFFYYGNFTFEDEITKSELEEEVKNSIDGVRSFRITTPESDIIQSDYDYQIFELGEVNITATGGDV